MKNTMFKKIVALCAAVLMVLSMGSVALAAGETPSLSGNVLYAKGVPVTIEAGKLGGVDILWNGGKLHYAGKDLVVYGGAAGSNLAHVTLDGGTVAAIYGGSPSGTVKQSVVLLESGWVTGGVYGGGFGTTENARIVVRGGNYKAIYGGGNGAEVDRAEIVANGGIIESLYAGGKGGHVGEAATEIGAASVKTVTAGGKGGSVDSSVVEVYKNSRIDLLQACSDGTVKTYDVEVYDGTVGEISCGAARQYADTANCGIGSGKVTLYDGSIAKVSRGYTAANGLWSATPLKSIRVELGQWFSYGKLEEDFGNDLEEVGRLESFEYDFDEEPCISVLQYRKQEAFEDHWDDVVDDLYDLRSGQVLEVDYDEEYPTIPVGVFDHVLDSGVTLNIENRGKYEYTFAPENLPVAARGRVVWAMGSLADWRSLMPAE